MILGSDFVHEELVVDGDTLKYKQLEGGFTQPNAGISVKMLQWAKNAAVFDERRPVPDAGNDPRALDARKRDDDFLELYCGNGNFTVAMAPMFRRVLATEVSKVSVAAAKENLTKNGVFNADVARLSSEELTRALVKTYALGADLAQVRTMRDFVAAVFPAFTAEATISRDAFLRPGEGLADTIIAQLDHLSPRPSPSGV